MRTEEPSVEQKPASARSVVLLAGFAGLFLIVGWSAYWYVAQRLAMRELHVQLDREARHGRIWSCNSLSSSGYPLSISIDCDTPNLRVEDSVSLRNLSVKRATVRAQLYAPTLVQIDLFGPALLEDNARKADINWSSLQIHLRGLPARLDRLSIVGRDLVAKTDDLPTTKIDALHAHLKRTAPTAMAPYGLTVGLAGVDWPLIDKFAGPGGPALLTLVGTVTQLDAAGAGHWAERLEDWRVAGGRLSVAALSLTRGDISLQGEGVLGLDQLHRPDGKLAVRFHNAGPALLALVEAAGRLDRNTIAGRLAGKILGGPGDLKFNVSAESGSLSIGPVRRMLMLPPLY